MVVRAAAVAGRFYPADPLELRQQIDGFLADVEVPAVAAIPKAIIGPHAGTVYSGPIAASVYAPLAAVAERWRRVILLGPCHYLPLRGIALSGADSFETPLGSLRTDAGMLERLRELPQVAVNDEAHRREHSLELHLPFLQRVLGDVLLVPLVVGQTSAEAVSEVIEACWGEEDTLIVVSSDLSHFHSYDEACVLDRETSAMLERLDYEQLSGERACGVYPLGGLLYSARRRGMPLRTIDVRNSGDTAGSRREVVGYGAYALHEPKAAEPC